MITQVVVPAKPQRAYAVCIGSGLLPSIIPELRRDWPTHRLFVVTDADLKEGGCLAALLGGQDVDVFAVDPPGERSKTIHTVEAIISALEQRRYGRDTLLIALGGGTVGDVGGFAAAIFKRGVPYVQVPTTTVAQADSAIGGKVGVDSDLSKNAYGAFHHPARVYIDCDTLRSLDSRHYRAGLVESVKHAMIADADYFRYLEANLDLLLRRDPAALQHLAARNCEIKGEVVFKDPEEANLRRILNYGHTIGHAVESASGFELPHGEAVAIGIVGACLLSERLGLSSPDARRRATAVFEKLGLPTALPSHLSRDALIDAMARDKKVRDRKARIVLLTAMGQVYAPGGQYAVEVAPDTVSEVLSALSAS